MTLWSKMWFPLHAAIYSLFDEHCVTVTTIRILYVEKYLCNSVFLHVIGAYDITFMHQKVFSHRATYSSIFLGYHVSATPSQKPYNITAIMNPIVFFLFPLKRSHGLWECDLLQSLFFVIYWFNHSSDAYCLFTPVIALQTRCVSIILYTDDTFTLAV